MHPAHTLPQGRVTVGAGVSGHFVTGEADNAIRRGRSAAQGGAASGDAEQRLVEGTVAHSTLAPGIAPWVGARAGLGSQTEAGLTYSGRAVRVDGRHAFEGRSYALSLGLGASAVLVHPGSGPPPEPGTMEPGAGRIVGSVNDINLAGWGFDLPVIGGWRSTGDVVMIWLGARGGYEQVSGDVLLASTTAHDELSAPLDGRRWFLGGLFGLAVGFQPVWVALELDANYQSASGTVQFPDEAGPPDRRDAHLSGVSVTPTGALIAKF